MVKYWSGQGRGYFLALRDEVVFLVAAPDLALAPDFAPGLAPALALVLALGLAEKASGLTDRISFFTSSRLQRAASSAVTRSPSWQIGRAHV